MHFVSVQNLSSGLHTPLRLEWCQSFKKKLFGLMFRGSIGETGGILLVENSESRSNAAIHMLFMRFDIGVVWIDHDFVVADLRYARKWRLAYIPKRPAQYVMEISPERLVDFKIGDRLLFEIS